MLDVAPVDEEGSDAEPDPEAVQRYSRECVCVCVCVSCCAVLGAAGLCQ